MTNIKIPSIKHRELVIILKRLGFNLIRTKGSHERYAHPDGRKTVVPNHSGRDIPKGLLITIIKKDLKMTIEQFREYI